MENGAGGLGETVVRGITEKQVAETEAILARELRRFRPNQLLTDERGEERCHTFLSPPECPNRAAMEDLSFDRAVLEHAPLGRFELIEPRGE